MSDIVKVTDHWLETVSDFILEQYRGAENWKAILKAVIDKIEDNVWKLASILDFKTRVKEELPSGELLDFIAGIVNIKRNIGESDAAFYERFIIELGRNNAGTPDSVIYSAAQLSGDPHPQYMDEAPATFFVYNGPRPVGLRGEPVLTENGQEILTEGGDTIETEPVPTWEQGGHQLSRSQVRKLAPAGVLGLPGAALQDAEGNYIVDAEGKLILLVADDENIEREVLLADNLGNIVITPQSVPVRVKLTGPAVPTIPVIETEWNGVPVDAVRIKDLPDGADTNGYMVRDSDTEGTVKSRAMDEAALDELWDSTPAEGEEG